VDSNAVCREGEGHEVDGTSVPFLKINSALHDASSGSQAVKGPQGPMDPAAVNWLLILWHLLALLKQLNGSF
jgi:hypothetical protein